MLFCDENCPVFIQELSLILSKAPVMRSPVLHPTPNFFCFISSDPSLTFLLE